MEFLEADAVNSATLLDGSELRGREIKVLSMTCARKLDDEALVVAI